MKPKPRKKMKPKPRKKIYNEEIRERLKVLFPYQTPKPQRIETAMGRVWMGRIKKDSK